MLKASDILSAQVVCQLGLAPVPEVRSALLDLDLGEERSFRDLVNRLEDEGLLDGDAVETVRHRVALYEHVWSEDCYIRHLEQRCRIAKEVVADLLIQLEKQSYRERVGLMLVRARKLSADLDRSIAVEAMQSLEQQLTQVVGYHRERDFEEITTPLLAGSRLEPEDFKLSTLFRSKQTIALMDKRRLAALRMEADDVTPKAPADPAQGGIPDATPAPRTKAAGIPEATSSPRTKAAGIPEATSSPRTKAAGIPEATPAPRRPNELVDTASVPPPGRDGLGGLESIGEYTIQEVLGVGGMGAVYLAKSEGTEEYCAVKVLQQECASEVERGRFQREIELTARIDHPNVIGILDHGETEDGLSYLVVPALFGKELRHYLQAGDGMGLPPVMSLRVLEQVLRGLGACHEAGIVHRDLKPENVFVLAGGKHEVKILDFGVAKPTSEAYGLASSFQTANREIVGTPAYMSPDAVTNDKIDARTDLYSLGVMLFEMLTGQLPLASATPEGWIGQHLISPPMTLAQACPDRQWPDELEALLKSLLGKSKKKRPANCSVILDQLEAGLGEAIASLGSPPEVEHVTQTLAAQKTAGYQGLLGRLLG